MKVLMFALTFVAPAIAIATPLSYKCYSIKGSTETSQIDVVLEGDGGSYMYKGTEGACILHSRSTTRAGNKAAYRVDKCGADNTFTVSIEMLSGGLTLRDGSKGGFARIDNNDEGGYFKSSFVCKLQ